MTARDDGPDSRDEYEAALSRVRKLEASHAELTARLARARGALEFPSGPTSRLDSIEKAALDAVEKSRELVEEARKRVEATRRDMRREARAVPAPMRRATGAARTKESTAVPRLRLPNAHQGQAYRGEFEGTDARIERVLGLEESGLRFEDGAVSGILSTDEDLELEVFDTEARRYRATLICIPDPRLLWKAVEPTDERHPKAHVDAQEVFGPGWVAVAASRRGRAHAHGGAYREDHVGLASDGPWMLAALSDGAGSAELSRVGSEVVCTAALAVLAEAVHGGRLAQASLDEVEGDADGLRALAVEVMQQVLVASREAIHGRAEELQVEATHLSATIIVLAVRPWGDGWLALGASIGDGAAAACDQEGGLHMLMRPDTGAWAGLTHMVTSEEPWSEGAAWLAEARTFVAHLDSLRGVLAMSDGVSDPKLGTLAEMSEPSTWATLLDELEALESGTGKRVLEWLDFMSRGEHDDRTLLWMRPD